MYKKQYRIRDIDDIDSLSKVKGIGCRKNGRQVLTTPEQVVSQERMDIEIFFQSFLKVMLIFL